MATCNIKQEFFHLLNLVATQNVKVKYCRTIKERLRPKTQEESNSLPKSRSPVKRKQDDAKSENVSNLEIRGGLTVLQTYKTKKKSRKKKDIPVTAPSSKSLLSYLHARVEEVQSSSAESDFSDPEILSTAARPGPSRLSNGFSEASVNKSIKQNQNLKNLISGLEEENANKSLQVEGGDIVMRMVQDFALMSESDSDDEPENLHKMSKPERSHLSKPNTILIEDREARDGKVMEEDLILREMLARFEKLENGKSEDKFIERFEHPQLIDLVKKVRRESKISRKFTKSLKQKKSRKGRILQRCNYLRVIPDVKPRKPYQCFSLSEESLSIRRLEKPSLDDVLLARKMNKIDVEVVQLGLKTEKLSSTLPTTMREDVSVSASQNIVKSSPALQPSEEEPEAIAEVDDKDTIEEKIKSVNDDFDVEVAYCDNMEILDVDNKTLFFIDNPEEVHSQNLKDSDEVVKQSKSLPATNLEPSSGECSEKIEDIRKFLAESENIKSLEECGDSKTDPKFPKGSLQSAQKISGTSDLKFTKETALKIISKSSLFVKNNIKNDIKSVKVHSFEEALNAALTPVKKAPKPVITKPVKPLKPPVQKAVVIPSTKISESKPAKSTKILSPVKSLETSPKKVSSLEERISPKKISVSKTVDVVSKIISQIDQTQGQTLSNEKKPAVKHLLNSPSRRDEVLSPESKRVKFDSSVVRGGLPRPPQTSQDIYNSLKRTLLADSQDINLTTPVSFHFSKPSKPEMPLETVGDYGKVGVDLPSCVSPVKAQGYYTSSTSSRSTPTLLPTVFPTFDSGHSSQGDKWPSIIHSGSKPTAVVPPSARSKMPALPKPVPAALGFSPLCDDKLTGLVCSRCGQTFSSKVLLSSHLQTQHFY